MAEIHEFNHSRIAGDEGELFLDRFFERRGNKVEHVTLQEQKGDKLDRRFTAIRTGQVALVEYKTDAKAAQTGNIFVETYSNAERGTPGWFSASKADWIITLVPGVCVLVTKLARIRACYAAYWFGLPHKSIPNRVGGNIYHTVGVPVSMERYIKESGAVRINIALEKKKSA